MNSIATTVDQDWLYMVACCPKRPRLSSCSLERLLGWNYALPFARFSLRGQEVVLRADVRRESAFPQLLRAVSGVLRGVASRYECLVRSHSGSGERFPWHSRYENEAGKTARKVLQETQALIREAISVDRMKVVDERESHGAFEWSWTCLDFRHHNTVQPLEIRVSGHEVVFQAPFRSVEWGALTDNSDGLIKRALNTWMLAGCDELVFARMALAAGDPLVVVRWPLRFLGKAECRHAVAAVPRIAAEFSGEVESLLNRNVAEEYLWRKQKHRFRVSTANRKEVK